MLKLAAVFLTFCVCGTAQGPARPAPPKQDVKPEQSAETKEFQAARNETDVQKKAAALEKFLKDHPKSASAQYARRELVTALVKASPERASKWIKRNGKHLAAGDRTRLYEQYANALLAEKQNLKEAEKYASRAVKDAPREDSGLKASAEATLGKVYLAQDRPDRAKRVLAEAVGLNPELSEAFDSLGALAEKSGDAEEALKWYAQAALTRPNKDRKARFAGAYARAKDGESGMEEYLDAEYHRMFPPAHAATYEKTPARSGRVVLVELYTGAGCPPCTAADVAFDGVLERYKREDVAVVVYHEHIPRPDPMANSDTVARWKFQQGRGVPTYGIDGEMMPGGGGARSRAPEIEKRLNGRIEKDLETAPGASLTLAAVNDGGKVTVTAEAGGAASTHAALHVLLLEKLIRYSGENGIRFHPVVVRSIAIFELKDGAIRKTHDFTKEAVNAALKKHIDDFEKHDDRHNKDGTFRFAERRDAVDWNNVAVVAFVQDLESKKVLQAAWADAPAPKGN